MRGYSWVFFGFLCVAGCGAAGDKTFKMSAEKVGDAGGAAGGKPVEKQAAEPVPEADPRKIIYTATVSIYVESLDEARKKLEELIDERKGYIASSDVSGESGSRRRGTWAVRIPVARYRDFLDAIAGLGEVQRSSSTAEDVTQEYYDVEARLKSKRVEEERLLEHLKKSTGKLEDILAVERELSRVRGEIEQAEGRMKYLTNRISFTTVTVTLSELKEYIPESSPTFGTQVSRTFSGSIDLLYDVGRGLALAAVAIVPWTPVLVLFCLLGWLARKRWRHDPAPTPAEPLHRDEGDDTPTS